MKLLATLSLVLGTSVLWAAPAVKPDPVAEGFPDWQGLTPKAYVTGRELTASDLRHKVTIVVDLALGEKFEEQLVLASKFARYGGTASLGFGDNWEDAELPRNVIMVVSLHNTKHDAYLEFLKPDKKRDKDTSSAVSSMLTVSTYDAITFTGAPDNGGKLPSVYVMGPTGTEPLFKGDLNEAGVKEAQAAVAKGRKEISEWETKWRPFFGNIAEPKFNTSLKKTLEKGKTAKKAPLDPVTKALLTDIKSKDPEKSKEAQILFDAINQTRSDLVYRIQLEASACPHRAYYDIQTLLKHWPAETKRLEKAYAQMKAVPDAEALGKMFIKAMEWSSPEFTCKNATEAKKIVAEIGKMRKKLEGPKESKNIALQNGALLLDMRLEALAAEIPNKVPAK